MICHNLLKVFHNHCALPVNEYSTSTRCFFTATLALHEANVTLCSMMDERRVYALAATPTKAHNWLQTV